MPGSIPGPIPGVARPWRVPALGVVTSVWAGLLLAWAYLSYASTPTLVSLGGDSAVYALTARHFQDLATGTVEPIAALAATGSVYPPLHPLLLALAGAGRGDSWRGGNLLVTVELLGALAVFYLWLQRRGHGWGTALVATLALAWLPGVWQQTVLLQSENLFLLTLLAALAWFEGAAPGARRLVMTPQGAAVARPWAERLGPWPGLACVALATLTRTAGVALLAGVALAWAWGRVAPRLAWRAPLAHRSVGRALAALGLAALPLVLWSVFHHPADSYTASLARTYGQGEGWLAPLLARSGQELGVLAGAWPALFGPLPGGAALAWVVAALGVVGLVGRAVRGRADGWFAALYLAMIVVWPFPAEAERFLLVLLPVVWAAALDAPRLAVGWWRERARGPSPASAGTGAERDRVGRFPPAWPAGVVASALLLALVPGAGQALGHWFAARPVAGRAGPPEDWRHRPVWYAPAPAEERMAVARAEDAYRALHASLDRLTPPGACVYSPKPSLSMVFGHRLAWGLPRPELDDAAFGAALREHRCRYLVVLSGATPTYPAQYPLSRLSGVEAARFVPSEQAPVALLVTLPPYPPAPP